MGLGTIGAEQAFGFYFVLGPPNRAEKHGRLVLSHQLRNLNFLLYRNLWENKTFPSVEIFPCWPREAVPG